MTPLQSIKRKINEAIGIAQDEMARGGPGAFDMSVLHDSLVFIRDTDLSRVPLDPQSREEYLDNLLAKERAA